MLHHFLNKMINTNKLRNNNEMEMTHPLLGIQCADTEGGGGGGHKAVDYFILGILVWTSRSPLKIAKLNP